MAVWGSQHDVAWTAGRVEARRYRPRVVAQVIVCGPQRAALDEGFSLLAAYILGKNDAGQVMELTVPLLQQKLDCVPAGSWAVQLILPDDRKMENLPRPLGSRVELRALPEATFATLRFSLSARARKLARKERVLREALAERGTAVVGEPIYAFYSSPLIPPFVRRNEVWLDITAGDEERA